MTTYRDLNSTGDTTRWLRDEATGLVTNKVYADGKGPCYDYTPDGKLATRTWARGIVTTYSYDANGALTNTVYSDGTPTISLAYNRAGRQIRAEDAAGVTTFLYDEFGSVTNETVVGVAGTNVIERYYDSVGRSLGYSLNGVRQSTLAYDPATGSLVSISDAVANTEYSYSSDLLDTGYTLTLSNGEVLSRSVIRDERCRLLVAGIVSLENGNSIDSFTYAYDVLSRPTQRNCDTFCYNDRSEVTSATIAAEEPYLTSTFYGYDDIGNLTMSTSNSGSSSFAANGLNQYTSISSDFASLCEPTYDIDGNMLSNGGITFTYDSKSRLVAAAGQNGEYIVSNRYDHLDRRVQKVTPAATHTFFYDGWMLIKEIVANTNGTTDVIEYHWGKDLSGTIGGAGGVGGLLYLKRNGAIYVPWYDAYGNVMGYWDAQGNVVAEYTYDAFGKLIASSGSMANVFSLRCSTKYFDPETGFYYYGYRYYSPELMRWITRDPIGEDGGVNLYAMCGNNCILKYDAIGLFSFKFMWRYPTQQELDRIKKISNEIAVYSDNFLRQISYFRASYFPQARSSNNVWFVPKEIDRTADLSKLPYSLVQHFSLQGHRERGSLNMALKQIENRLRKEKALQTYHNFRVSTCRNVLCRTGAIDALTTPLFIGVCENNLRDMSDCDLRMLLGHEASHKFHDTQDYYYMYDEKKIYDAYSWGMIYGE